MINVCVPILSSKGWLKVCSSVKTAAKHKINSETRNNYLFYRQKEKTRQLRMLMTRHHVRKGGLKLAMGIMIGKGIKTSRKRKPYTNEPHGPKRVNTQNYYVCSRGIRYQNISATFSPFRVENKTAYFYRNPILLSGPDGQNC